MSRKVNVPICEKLLLTIEETSEYSNIGKDKLYNSNFPHRFDALNLEKSIL